MSYHNTSTGETLSLCAMALMIVVIVVIGYWIYKTCFCNKEQVQITKNDDGKTVIYTNDDQIIQSGDKTIIISKTNGDSLPALAYGGTPLSEYEALLELTANSGAQITQTATNADIENEKKKHAQFMRQSAIDNRQVNPKGLVDDELPSGNRLGQKALKHGNRNAQILNHTELDRKIVKPNDDNIGVPNHFNFVDNSSILQKTHIADYKIPEVAKIHNPVLGTGYNSNGAENIKLTDFGLDTVPYM